MYKREDFYDTLFWNMHAQLYPSKYENSIFALQSIGYNVESCSHEREGTKQRKTKLSEIQYTTSWMKYICTWVPIWNAALNLGRMCFAYECIWINHATHEVMISLSHSSYAYKTFRLPFNSDTSKLYDFWKLGTIAYAYQWTP